MLGKSAFLDFGGPVMLVLAAAALAVLVFEVFMLVSAIRNPFITPTARALWIVGMLLVHPVVAIVYYFTDYQKRA